MLLEQNRKPNLVFAVGYLAEKAELLGILEQLSPKNLLELGRYLVENHDEPQKVRDDFARCERFTDRAILRGRRIGGSRKVPHLRLVV